MERSRTPVSILTSENRLEVGQVPDTPGAPRVQTDVHSSRGWSGQSQSFTDYGAGFDTTDRGAMSRHFHKQPTWLSQWS